MKKLLILSVLIWYFGIRVPADQEGVFTSMVQGPYKTEKECKLAYEQAVAMMESFGVPFEKAPCKAIGDTI